MSIEQVLLPHGCLLSTDVAFVKGKMESIGSRAGMGNGKGNGKGKGNCGREGVEEATVSKRHC